MAKKINKYVITAKVVVLAKSPEKAKEDFLNQLARREDNHPCADSLIEQYDEDTTIVSVNEGIFTADKIKITGYDGIKIETAIGYKVMTKYGDEFTIKSWDEETRTFKFEETDKELGESRISFG